MSVCEQTLLPLKVKGCDNGSH